MTKTSLWNQIWNERGNHFPEDDAMAISGFDQSFGTINQKNFHFLVEDIKEKLELKPTDTVLEVGCGAGALSNALIPFCYKIHSTDLAHGMVERAIKLYPHLDVVQSDPLDLPYPAKKFDKAFVHSVFQYFSDYSYAESVIDEISRVTKDSCLVLIADVMDLDTKEAYLDYRNQAPSSKAIWKSSVTGNIEHLYYSRKFFEKFSSAFQVKTLDRNIPHYENGKYRFDVILRRSP